MKHLPEIDSVLGQNYETREAYFGKSPVPPDIKFEIVDIQIVADDNKRKQARIKVKVMFAESSWHKTFGFPIDGIIEFETLRTKLQEEISRDFRVDRAISELVQNRGKVHPLFDK